MPISLQTFSNHIQQLTYQLVRYQGICDRVFLEQLEVTSAQAYALLAFRQTASLTMNDLSEAMGLANSTMTRTVDQLVQKGLVDREPDSEDRRVVRVRLSGQGQKTQLAVKSVLQDFFKQALSEIPEGEREAVLQSLESVKRAIANGLASCCDVTVPAR